MSLTPTDRGPNAFAPGARAEAFIPDRLIAGHHNLVTDTGTITGAAALVRGSVLGQATLGAATSAAKAGGNTGNGTFVLDATTPVLANAAPGVYLARFTTTTNIRLEGAAGAVLGDIAIGGVTGNTVTISEQIKGVVTQGATPFAAGDGFDITIAAGSNKYKLATAAAVDGSAVPVALLVDNVDPSGGDKRGGLYLAGEFNEDAVTLGAGITLAAAKAALRGVSIYLKPCDSAADPT